jgi:hypothetical protein
MKANSQYRMSKQSKIFLGNAWNRRDREQYRRALIQAELDSKIVVRAKIKDN